MDLYKLIKNRVLFIGLFTVLIRINCYGTCSEINNYDTNFVKVYRKILAITASASTKQLDVKLRNLANSNKLNFFPSPYASFGVEIDTRLWSISFNPSFLTWNSNSSKYGKTYQYDTKATLNFNPVIFNFNFQLYQGLFLKNESDFKQLKANENYYLQNNLQALTFGCNAYYVFNYKRYAHTAPYNYTTSQLKSAGSFITGLTYEYFDLKNDSGIIHPLLKYEFDSTLNFNSANSHYYTLNFGYGYTFVIKNNFYISPTIILGGGINNFNHYLRDTIYLQKKGNLATQINAKIGIGWDNTKWYCGLNALYNDYNLYGINKSMIEFDKITLKIFLGHRFSTAKIHNYIISKLKKKLDDI